MQASDLNDMLDIRRNDLLYKPRKTKQDINILLSVHKNLIYWCLSRYNKLYDADAESAAWEALWDAIATYNVYDTVAFSTYAVRVIKNRIGDVIRKQNQRRVFEIVPFDEDFDPVDASTSINSAYEAKELLDKATKLVDQYIDMKQDSITKNILIVWRAANFDITKTMIATICRTSCSKVCEALNGVRAYVSGRLRD